MKHINISWSEEMFLQDQTKVYPYFEKLVSSDCIARSTAIDEIEIIVSESMDYCSEYKSISLKIICAIPSSCNLNSILPRENYRHALVALQTRIFAYLDEVTMVPTSTLFNYVYDDINK